MTILKLSNVDVEYDTRSATVHAANDISFEVGQDEKVGIVGESGCGKSTIVRAILQLLPDNGKITAGSIDFLGEDLVEMGTKKLQNVRWERMSTITQSAMNALDPVYTVGDQITEAIQLHRDMTDQECRNRSEELFGMVGLDPERVDSYPHQLSGGMRQRAMIAMALALEPDLIIADEPTTALDVITQDHIIDEINDLSEETSGSMLIITHDISVVAETCDKVGVMYGGELVEFGPTTEVFSEPEHPYTLGLLNAFPSIENEKEELITMPGQPPEMTNPPNQCIFYDRCPYREPQCKESQPPLTKRKPNHKAACFVSEDGTDLKSDYTDIIEDGEIWKKL